MSFSLFYKRPIHSTLYLLLSIIFTEKLVRYILFKFHSYFNQHKVNVIEAFLMPFITLISSLFINIKDHKINFELILYDYYPHLRLPYRTFIYSNILFNSTLHSHLRNNADTTVQLIYLIAC